SRSRSSAIAIAARQSVVFPMPASPSSTSATAPPETPETNCPIDDSSASRPTSSVDIVGDRTPTHKLGIGPPADNVRLMAFSVFGASELDWQPRDDESGREVARLSDSLSQSRANLWRYPPGARGK